MPSSRPPPPSSQHLQGAHPAMSPGVVVLMLTLLLGIQPLTTDLYLPALPTLRSEFGAGMPAVQLTLSSLIIAFGVAQLVCGPLSDRCGRRPVLLAGMAAYTVASVFSALSPSIEALIGWRAVQGAAMAAAVTCGRSMLRDLYLPHEGAQVMSKAMTRLGVIAMLSPLVGGMLVQWVHWHAALMVLALFGAVTLGMLVWRHEETLAVLRPEATRPGVLVRNWTAVLSHRTFRAWAALSALAYGGLFCILAGSAFVYIQLLGLSQVAYGLVMAVNSLAYIAGTFMCRWLLQRFGLRGAVKRAAWFTLLGGGGMALLELAGVQGFWAVLLPQLMFAFGHGIHQPCSQAGAVGPFPDKAGTAASLSGFLMMASAFAVGLVLGRLLDDAAAPMTLGVGSFSLALTAVAWSWVQRDGEPALPPPVAAGVA